MLDRLPAWLRHLVIAFAAVAGSTVAQAVIEAGGVSQIVWTDLALDALDAGAVAVALVAATLWLTPLTKQYGVGAGGDSDDVGNP